MTPTLLFVIAVNLCNTKTILSPTYNLVFKSSYKL